MELALPTRKRVMLSVGQVDSHYSVGTIVYRVALGGAVDVVVSVEDTANARRWLARQVGTHSGLDSQFLL